LLDALQMNWQAHVIQPAGPVSWGQTFLGESPASRHLRVLQAREHFLGARIAPKENHSGHGKGQACQSGGQTHARSDAQTSIQTVVVAGASTERLTTFVRKAEGRKGKR